MEAGLEDQLIERENPHWVDLYPSLSPLQPTIETRQNGSRPSPGPHLGTAHVAPRLAADDQPARSRRPSTRCRAGAGRAKPGHDGAGADDAPVLATGPTRGRSGSEARAGAGTADRHRDRQAAGDQAQPTKGLQYR